MKYIPLLIFALLASGCATSRSCPSELEEPVSECRARAACGADNKLAAFFDGFRSNDLTTAVNRESEHADINACISRQLYIQANNAALSSREPATTISDESEPNFDKDYTDCQVKAGQAGIPRKNRAAFTRRCMSGQGWTAERVISGAAEE